MCSTRADERREKRILPSSENEVNFHLVQENVIVFLHDAATELRSISQQDHNTI